MKIVAKSLLACLAVATFHSALAEERVSLPSRPGVETRFIYQSVAQPVAQAILFEGGNGIPGGSNAGFLDTSRTVFSDLNVSYAMFAPPSDHAGGLRDDPRQLASSYRVSDDHIRDVEPIIAWLRQKSPAPIWLVGVSAGTISVGWLGTRVREPVDGLVFSSSIFRGTNRVGTLGLQNIRVPTMITHHAKDGCKYDPPEMVQVFTKFLPAEIKREIRLFDGGGNRGSDPCHQGTFHTYYGIERDVATAIVAFIKDNSRR